MLDRRRARRAGRRSSSGAPTFGRQLVAIGGNRPPRELAGLPVKRVLISVYVISGVLAAVAGILATARLQASDPSSLGLLMELSAITAVVVGGTPLTGGRIRVLGTVAGALLMQLLAATLIKHNLPDSLDPDGPGGHHPRRRLRRPGGRQDPMTATSSHGRPPQPTTGRRGAGRRPLRERVGALVQQHGALAVAASCSSSSARRRSTSSRTVDNPATSLIVRVVPGRSIALGMTFVIITGGIDLSVGSLFVARRRARRVGSQYGVAGRAAAAARGVRAVRPGQGPAHRATRGWRRSSSRSPALLGARGLMLAALRRGRAPRTWSTAGAFAQLGQGELLGIGYPVWLVAGRCSWSAWCCCTAPASASPSTRSAAARTRPR